MVKHFLETAAVMALGLSILVAQTAVTEPAFDVASVKPGLRPRDVLAAGKTPGMKVDGARIDILCLSLQALITIAYQIEPYQLTGPDWMGSERFDIQAKLPNGSNREQVPAMLRSLLADRFKLVVRREPKETSVYALLVGKDGSKLKESKPDAGKSPQPMTAGPGDRVLLYRIQMEDGMATICSLNQRLVYEAVEVTIRQMIPVLMRYTDAPVIDKTGLAGAYEVALDVPRNRVDVAGRVGAGGGVAGVEPRGEASNPDISILSSVQKLGLRLDKQKVMLDHIVVDHIERAPTEN